MSYDQFNNDTYHAEWHNYRCRWCKQYLPQREWIWFGGYHQVCEKVAKVAERLLR